MPNIQGGTLTQGTRIQVGQSRTVKNSGKLFWISKNAEILRVQEQQKEVEILNPDPKR